ncbi:hypothetical protein SKAU_G00145520 [Synaphobranchus kaupii]|uniref:Uncharacterized protein n=1 Tax=Synaphobranchus kaupii TaxID=118154 RepID=A0A9Q1J4E5_SYNKA|nr:hypothetical protein SKAU_G00145520 [Synaphobranchus kaupii]
MLNCLLMPSLSENATQKMDPARFSQRPEEGSKSPGTSQLGAPPLPRILAGRADAGLDCVLLMRRSWPDPDRPDRFRTGRATASSLTNPSPPAIRRGVSPGGRDQSAEALAKPCPPRILCNQDINVNLPLK